jgi:putative copper resistance protein D
MIIPLRDHGWRWSALVLALAAGIAWAGLAAAQMAEAMDRQVVVATATDTLFGQLFLARMAALLGMGLLLILRRGRALMVALSATALALPAATSHAAAASPAGFAAIGAATDALHLLTAGFWMGGLVILLLLVRRREPNLLLALSLFSDWGMAAVLLLAMTGLINSASILLGPEGKMSPPYLGLLGAKLALVAVMVGLALVNRFRLMPRAREAPIARNMVLELSLGLGAVLLAGALGQLQPLR